VFGLSSFAIKVSKTTVHAADF